MLTMFYLFTCLGLIFIMVGLWRYFKSSVTKSISIIFAEFKIGNILFRLSDVFCLITIGCLVIGYNEFLDRRTTWGYILSEDHICKKVEQELSTLVPQKYRKLLMMEEEKEELPEDERLLDLSSGLYYNGEFEKCLDTLSKVKTSQEKIRDEIIYYSIMAQFRIYEEAVSTTAQSIHKSCGIQQFN